MTTPHCEEGWKWSLSGQPWSQWKMLVQWKKGVNEYRESTGSICQSTGRYRWGSEEDSIAIHLLYRHWWCSQSLNGYSLLWDWVAQAELKWCLWTPKWQSSFGELLFCLAEIVGLQGRSACISRSWRVYNISLDHKMNRTTVNRILEIIKAKRVSPK